MIHHDPDTHAAFHTCDHCTDEPMTYVVSRMGTIELCWVHAQRFTGWSAEDLERRHAPLRDHLSDTKRWAYKRQINEVPEMTLSSSVTA